MNTSTPECSIVIPCFNLCRFTELCLRTIRQYTDGNYEIVIVDNGCTDETFRLLSDWKDQCQRESIQITVLRNAQNVGYVRAVNQGLRVARGRYIVLLNNDVVVSAGWLSRLVAALESDHSVGLVGPTSNCAAPWQLVHSAPYRNLREFSAFAQRRAITERDKLEVVRMVSGFCVVMKAETIRRLGGLDERFELGLFDDDDLCLRFWREGYKVCVAKDVYVHHFGSMTFRNLGVDTARLYRENRIRFEEKWLGKGSAVPSSSRVFEHGGAEIEATTYVDALWLCRRPFGEK